MSEQQPATTSTATANQDKPDDSEPTPERQAELQAAYEANVAAGRAPYAKVEIRTRGEMAWVCRERNWSGEEEADPGQERPNLSGANLGKVNLSGAVLYGADLSDARLSEARLNKANLGAADLSRAVLIKAYLGQANLTGTNLSEADLSEAVLSAADLSGARLSKAVLRGAMLYGAELGEANLTEANLAEADLSHANLSWAFVSEANLSQANLSWADLSGAVLYGANLSGAVLYGADLQDAVLSHANLSGVDLARARLIETNFERAKLLDCAVYGIAAWDLQLDGAEQANLDINAPGQPRITVDDVEVAQFLYLMLHNSKIRRVIDTLTSKVVLLLGRFTPERKAVLDGLREALRQRNYVPVLFDFEGPDSHDFTETVTLLARMARFIIADLTEPSSIPQELQAIVPDVVVPVLPLLAEGTKPFAMFVDHRKYPWMLPIYRYASRDALLAAMQEHVIAPAEAKVREIRAFQQTDAE